MMPSEQNQRTGKRRVALFGTFDTANFGDCLFPLIVRQQLAKRLEDVEVILFSPTNRLVKTANYATVHALDELGERLDGQVSAFMIGGGALLSTEHVLFSYPEVRMLYPYSLKCWLLPSMIACAWECPLIVNGVGLGPFDTAYAALAAKYLEPAAVCGVRDGITQAFLNDLGVQSRIVPDSGLLVPELQTHSEWEARYSVLAEQFRLPERYLAVQASLYLGSQLEAFAASVAEAAREAGLPVVLVPLCHHLNDLVSLRLMRRGFNRKGVKTVLINRVLTTIETSAVLSRAALFVGTSLHGALVTLSFGRRVVSFSLATMSKNRAALAVLGCEASVVHDPVGLSDAIGETLSAPGAPYAAALARARVELGVFFDEVCDVIWSRGDTSGRRPVRLRMSSGEVQCGRLADDLARVKELSDRYRKTIPLTRRCAACLIRNSRTLSEWYDCLRHWVTVKKAWLKPTPSRIH